MEKNKLLLSPSGPQRDQQHQQLNTQASNARASEQLPATGSHALTGAPGNSNGAGALNKQIGQAAVNINNSNNASGNGAMVSQLPNANSSSSNHPHAPAAKVQQMNATTGASGFGSNNYTMKGESGNNHRHHGNGMGPSGGAGVSPDAAQMRRPSKEETVVFFRGVTWMRDSHGLFDYESRNISKKNLKTQYTGKIVRQQNSIEFVSPNTRIEDLPGYKKGEFTTLAQIKQDSNGFFIEHGDVQAEEESIDRLWLVVRSLKNPDGKFDYKIRKFDAIKLGRVRFRVKDFRCEQMNLTPKELFDQELKEAQTVKTARDFDVADQVQCRFCWGNEEDSENPLILACKCRGSVGLIHFQCLKSWIKTQRHTKEYGENVTSYYWKKFECEICKQSYPYIFKQGQSLFKLIDIQVPKEGSSYILLESMPLDKNTSRNIHLLTVTEKKSEFKLGRGHESEVRINDISVSRCHAIIKCRQDGFYIEDNLSKFGTIVLLKNTLRLAEDHTMAVQVGRSVVSFTIKNIDIDRKMREKLKREIRPLLSCNKGKTPQEIEAAAQAKNTNDDAIKRVGTQNQMHGGDPNSGSGREESKRLNELGNDILTNQRMVSEQLPGNGIGALGNYGVASAIQRTQTSVVGNGIAGHASNPANALLSQSNVSHSALVNSGNAAILGHNNNLNSLNLNSNNNNLINGNPSAQVSPYGTNANHNMHGGNPPISRENIFADMQMPAGGAHLLGAQRAAGAGVGHSDQLKFTGAASMGTQQSVSGGNRSSFASRTPAGTGLNGNHSAANSRQNYNNPSRGD